MKFVALSLWHVHTRRTSQITSLYLRAPGLRLNAESLPPHCLLKFMAHSRTVYNGKSQKRRQERKPEAPEERKRRKEKTQAKKARLKKAIDKLVQHIDDEVDAIAVKFKKDPDSVRLRVGGHGAEAKPKRAPNPWNGWTSATVAKRNAGEYCASTLCPRGLTKCLLNRTEGGRETLGHCPGPSRTQTRVRCTVAGREGPICRGS